MHTRAHTNGKHTDARTRATTNAHTICACAHTHTQSRPHLHDHAKTLQQSRSQQRGQRVPPRALEPRLHRLLPRARGGHVKRAVLVLAPPPAAAAAPARAAAAQALEAHGPDVPLRRHERRAQLVAAPALECLGRIARGGVVVSRREPAPATPA